MVHLLRTLPECPSISSKRQKQLFALKMEGMGGSERNKFRLLFDEYMSHGRPQQEGGLTKILNNLYKDKENNRP